MATTFDTFVNNAHATLAGAYTPGSGSLTLTAGQGAQFGSTFPIRVTLITAATYRTSSEVSAIYTVSGRSTDTLTGVAVAEGTTDQAFAADTVVELRFTAAEANMISTAINTLQNAGYGPGTVTSVSWTGDGTIFTAGADTPVTTSGTLTPASLISQPVNRVLAGPGTGSTAAAPTFRALVSADLPATPSLTGLTASGAVSAGSLSIASGNFSVDSHGHLITAGSTPSFVAGAGAGTSPTISIVGNDVCGQINVTPGSGSTGSSTVATITFAAARAAAPRVVLVFPQNYAAYGALAANKVYCNQSSLLTTGWILTNDGSTALTPGTNYIWGYLVIG